MSWKRMSNAGVAEAFAAGVPDARGSSMFTELDHAGRLVVYSYGRHFPIAYWERGMSGLVINTADRSVTTSRHKAMVARAVSRLSGVWLAKATYMELP